MPSPNLSRSRTLWKRGVIRTGRTVEKSVRFTTSPYFIGVIIPKPPMFGFCPLSTPMFCPLTILLSRRAGSNVDATAVADRTRKPRGYHVSTGQNKKRRGERIAEGSGEGAAAE